MTDIERMEADMRAVNNGCVCSVCAHFDKKTREEPCYSCETPSLKGFKWRGRGEEAPTPDPVERPTHYTSGDIECINAMTAAFGKDAVKDFCLCNTFKYLWRRKAKNDVEDLKKARWYLNRLIGELEEENDERG